MKVYRKQTAISALSLLLAACGGSGPSKPSCVESLLAGDLVITEIMANPLDRDEGKEWFEIFNPGQAHDLTGLRVVAARADGSGEAEHYVVGANIAAGDYLVLGGMIEAVKPAYVDYAYGADLGGLRNSGGKLSLYCGDALVDTVTYLEASDGVALQLDGTKTPDSIINDDSANWCDARTEYDPVAEPGALGSPGLPNQPCETNLPPTSCREGDSVRDVVAPQPGDLVITEVMPNPAAVDDSTGEWFEVLVNREVDLNGLKMGKNAASLDQQLVSLTCLRVTAGTYLIFARTEDGTANGGLPWVDFTFDFGLTNSGGGLALGYGEVLLDEVSWSSSPAGKSLALEPSLTDPQQNDNQAYWCEGQQAYGAGDLGSPGQPNPDCGITPEGKCRDGGQLRDQRIPGPGDLVITEIMADPSAAPDADGEWFEVYAVRDLDLNHLQIGKTFPTVELELPGGDCLSVAAGTYVVLARNSDPQANGGLPSVLSTFDFGLTNSGGSLFIAFDGQLLDAVTYGAATAGASTQLDAARIDPTSNDDPSAWCATPAGNTYGAGDRGTPAAANPSCQ